MLSQKRHWEKRLGQLNREFEILEQIENAFEKKLKSQSNDSREKLQVLPKFTSTQRTVDNFLTGIENNTVDLRDNLCKLVTIADKFFLNNP